MKRVFNIFNLKKTLIAVGFAMLALMIFPCGVNAAEIFDPSRYSIKKMTLEECMELGASASHYDDCAELSVKLQEGEDISDYVAVNPDDYEGDPAGYIAAYNDYMRNNNVYKIVGSECDIQEMQYKYQSSCYSCKIVKTLIMTFMSACSKVYGVAQNAGVYILIFATLIWMVIFVMKSVSSMANVEPADMVNEILQQLFKVLVAYVFIVIGVSTIVRLFINPLLATGADYGIGIIEGAAQSLPIPAITNERIVNGQTVSYNADGVDILSAKTVNRLMALNQSIDKVVSINLVVGHALTCHATHAGMITIFDHAGVTLRFIDLWVWLCGAIIWAFGFLLTVAVSYYLLDVSFKIGLAIMIMPVAIALWPFKPTSDKIGKLLSIILAAAATFAFLAITTTFALTLISKAMRDTDTLLKKVSEGDTTYISETFDITGDYFIIIVFALIYGFLLIGKTISDYSSKFFSDEVTGETSPMHHKLTQATMMVKKGIEGTTKYAKDVAVNQGKKAAGKAVNAAGNAAQGAGRAVSKGGKGMMRAGAKMSSTGLGAVVGVPMMIAGAAVTAAGKTAEVAGKAAKQVGNKVRNHSKGK